MTAIPLFGESPLDSLKAEAAATWRTDPEGALQTAKNLAEIATQEEAHAEIAWSFNFQGIVFGALGEFDSSFAYYDRALTHARAHGIQEVEKKTLMNLAINYQYQGRYSESMEKYLEAVRIFEAESDTLGLAHAYNGMAAIHRFLEAPRKSISAYKKALGYYQDLGAESQMGVVWSNLGSLYRDVGKQDSALICFDEAEVLMERFEDRIGLASLYINRAGIHEKANGDLALQLYSKAYEIGTELSSARIIALSSTGKGRQALMGKKYRMARSSGEKALEVAEEMDDLQLQQEALEILSEANRALGKHKAAFGYQKRLKAVSDSIAGLESQKAIAELEIKYDTEKKEREIAIGKADLAEKQTALLEEQLKVGRLSNWVIGTVAIGLLLIGALVAFFIFRSAQRKRRHQEETYRKQLEHERREREMADEKLRISRELHDNIGSQITFMVSSLDNVKMSLEESLLAEKLDDLMGFGRDAIADLRHAIWALKSDTTLEAVVLKIRQLTQRISSHLDLKVEMQEQIDVQRNLNSVEAINLMRIVQEALQNAGKHSDADKVTLTIHSKKDLLWVEISDNGKGFDLADASRQGGEGLRNMRSRAAAMGAQMVVRTARGKGTRIELEKAFAD